jgi:dihydroorotate dehydrogenase electron transfer subunit
MKNEVLKIVSNTPVGKDQYLMTLKGDLSEIKNSGEFIEIKLDGYYLRRPISVCEFTETEVKILYKVLGHGTKDMSTYEVGTELECLVGLGNGFDITKSTKPLLVAGGIGIAPLVGLAKRFNSLGIKPTLIYGAANKNEFVLLEELQEYTDLHITTDDGSLGFKGNPVTFLKEHNLEYDYYYSCGPQVMLKYLALHDSNGCVSLEARMGCGFGACMGCSIQTINGPKRVCKEGPVFEASEVIL